MIIDKPGQTLLREFTDSIVYLHIDCLDCFSTQFARNHAHQIAAQTWPET